MSYLNDRRLRCWLKGWDLIKFIKAYKRYKHNNESDSQPHI